MEPFLFPTEPNEPATSFPSLLSLSSLFPPLSLVRVYPVEPLNKGHLETSNVSFIEVSLEVL